MRRIANASLLSAGSFYVVVLLGWFLWQPVPALQDFLEWVFQGWAFDRVLSGDPQISAKYALVHTPVPNMLVQLLVSALSSMFGPFSAAKILVAAYIVLGVTTCWRLARRFARSEPIPMFVLLLGLGVFNACFWHGYINYQIALLLILLYIEISHGDQPTAGRILVFSLLLYCCHASMFAAFLLFVAVREWRRPERLRLFAAMLPGAVLLVFYFVSRRGHKVAGASHGVVTRGLLSHVAYKGYTLAKAGPFHNLVIANGTSATRWPVFYHLGVALNFGFAVCVLIALVLSIRALLQRSTLKPELWGFFGVLALLVLLLPADIAEVVNLGERFLYLLLIMLILELGASPWIRWLAALSVLGFALTMAQLPGASLSGVTAPEASHHAPETEGRAYAADGLFSHRLYQNDERRIELREKGPGYEPLLFDTGLLRNKAEAPDTR